MTFSGKQLTCMKGGSELFRDLDFSISPGTALRITGNNGSGKTSLLRILSGLAEPTEGEVSWNGRSIKSHAEEFRSQLIYLGHLNALDDDLSALENVWFACQMAGLTVTRNAISDFLKRNGLSNKADIPTRVLSQGQKKRLALARLEFAAQRPCWLLDEPFSALDEDGINYLKRKIDEHLERGGNLVLTTHQDVELSSHVVSELELVGEC